MNNSEHIIFPKPTNIFEEIMENGIESIMTVPKIAIQYISVCIQVMEKAKCKITQIMNVIITTVVIKDTLSVYLYIMISI